MVMVMVMGHGLMYLIKIVLCVTNLMPENSLKLMSTNHHVRCIVSLGTLTCYQLKIFFTFKKEKHKVHGNKVLALARLTY